MKCGRRREVVPERMFWRFGGAKGGARKRREGVDEGQEGVCRKREGKGVRGETENAGREE